MPKPQRMASIFGAQALLLVALVAVDGCSSDAQEGTSGSPCNSGEDCALWSCLCKNGTNLSISACALSQCEDGQTACESACSSSGGVQSFHEKATVKDSPECDAFCAKAASLGCSAEPRCDRHFYCDVDDDECPDAKRTHLRCVAEQGNWACSSTGGWTMSSGCPSARCGRDAGAD